MPIDIQHITQFKNLNQFFVRAVKLKENKNTFLCLHVFFYSNFINNNKGYRTLRTINRKKNIEEVRIFGIIFICKILQCNLSQFLKVLEE